MKSQSSPRKSDSKVSREHADKLLRHGAVIKSPKPELLVAAQSLVSLGLIEIDLREIVLCANPEDGDFPRKNRDCPGRILLNEGHDDSAAELCCPVCGRRVFPDHYSKRRFSELRSSVSRNGVVAFCKDLLREIDASVVGVADGVFRLGVTGSEVFVCLIEFLTDGMYWSQSWAALNAACYITVNPSHARFPDGDWLTTLTLAELVCGDTQLQDVLKSVSAKGRPRNVPHASVALFGKGPRHAIVQPQRETLHDRRFIVEVGQNVVRVENVQVVWKQADSRFLVFETLWTWFLTDLGEGRAPKDFRSWSLANLASELTARTKREYDDLESVRRMINRLQVDIETAIKKNSGLPIGRDDIIETCGTKGKSEQGYRINPFTVLVRPMDAILSE